MNSYRLDQYYVESDIELPCPTSRLPGGEPLSMRYHADTLTEFSSIRWLGRRFGGHFLRAYEVPRGILICAGDEVRMLAEKDGAGLVFDFDAGKAAARALAAALAVNLGLSVCTLLRGDLALHASGLAIDGSFFALMAPSGAGKTTLSWALLDRGARFGSDDEIVVRHEREHIIAFPSVSLPSKQSTAVLERLGETWRPGQAVYADDGKVWAPIPPERRVLEPQRLRAICYLDPQPPRFAAESVDIRRPSPAEALGLLMSQTRGLWATEKVLDGRKTLDRYLALAATVPIYILRYPKRLDLLPRLADIVRQIAAPVPSPRPRVAASQPRACAGATSDRPRLARYFGFSRTDHKSRATEAEMNPINILRWAAGADIGLPRFDGVSDKRLLNLLGIDSDALVDTVVLHRLTGRFLARAASERPAWCSPALVARLAATMSKVRFDASRRIQALREIAAAFGDDAHPPIAVKGPSVYAITRDDAVVHESEDLDVLAGDTEALEATLQALGYRGERRNGYHFAAMRSRCSTIGVEIHRAFPFVSYPYDLAAEACAPGREPRIVDQSCGDFQESALSYPDILKCSLRPTTGLATGIAVADASMSALILCAHAFRHYIESGARRIPVVRLGELADIASLAAHPQFDPKTFAALATAYGAADSISFIGSLLKGCYGRDLLSETLQTRSRRSSDIFPRMLTRRGGWASGLTFEEVLRPLDSRAGFYRQHPNPIVATTSSEARAYGLFAHTDRGPDRPEPIRSALVHSTEREHLPIRFSARKEADGLVLAISIGRPLRRRHRYEVVAQIAYSDNEEFADLAAPEENIRRRIGIDASGDVWREGEDQTAASSMHLGPNGCEARLFMPWTMFRAAFPAMVQLPLMLSILHARELADTKPRMLGKRGFSPPTAVFVPLMVDLGGRTSGAQRCAY